MIFLILPYIEFKHCVSKTHECVYVNIFSHANFTQGVILAPLKHRTIVEKKILPKSWGTDTQKKNMKKEGKIFL